MFLQVWLSFFIAKAISFEKRCFDLSKIQREQWKLVSKHVEVYDVSYVTFQNMFLHSENKAQTTTPVLHFTFRKYYENSHNMYKFQEAD